MMVANSTSIPWLSYQRRFAAIAEAHPQRIALVDRSLELTYRDLDQETDLISLKLQSLGVVPDDLIVIYMASSSAFVLGCLAILKSGAAFLPIPTDLPAQQINLILADATPKVILSTTDRSESLSGFDVSESSEIIYIDLEPRLEGQGYHLLMTPDTGAVEAKLTPLVETTPDNVCFATYTSGTTGKPKGVLQIQRALVGSYEARHLFNPYQEGERVACNVFFMWEILRPLMVGSTTCVIPDELLSAPKKLTSYLARIHTTEVLFTPSAFQRLIRSLSADELREKLSKVRTIWLNGEVVTAKLLQEALLALPLEIKLLNTYSICECHDVSNADLRRLDLDEITQKRGGICPVGYADRGVVVKVMTETGLSSMGEGELYISGHGLGPGYLHLEALTHERFPVIDQQAYYATGDRASIEEDGLITIKGRLGTMVKMRGYSVYLNSIEEALHLHPQIKEARVFLRGAHLSHHLTAFIIGDEEVLSAWIDDESQAAPRLRKWLKAALPAYMIPSKYIRLDHFPVHPISGKLDQEILWSLEREAEISLKELSLRPQDQWADCIELMRLLWARSLELDVMKVDLETDFYESGGHSLSMVDLVLSVEQVFDVQLNGDELYEHPRLGEYLEVSLTNHRAYTLRNPSHRTPTHDVSQSLDNKAFLPFWCEEDLELSWPSSVTLDESGQPLVIKNAQRTPLANARHVLLTGATGHLGITLLETLLRETGDETIITCVVRGREHKTGHRESGEQRLVKKYSKSGHGDLSDQLRRGQLRVIEGDICDPQLGLDSSSYHELSQEVDVIFHCAALVNLRALYTQTRESIVDGSRYILHFAAHQSPKTVHYISTNSVLAHTEIGLHEEREVTLTDAERLADGYSQAKWVAEQLMSQAASLGLPVTVYRPGNIGPHQVTQYNNPDDLSALIWGACAREGRAPQDTGWHFEVSPVDVISTMIVGIAQLNSPRAYYHLVHPITLDADQLFAEWRAKGWLSAEEITWREWRKLLMSSSDPASRVLGASLHHFNQLLTSEDRFSVKHLTVDLPECSHFYEVPPSLEGYFNQLFSIK